MTTKDFVKLMCILGGFDKDFTYETYSSNDITYRNYEVHVKSRDEVHEINIDEYGLVNFLHVLFEELRLKDRSIPMFLQDLSVQELLNDDYRDVQYEINDAIEVYAEKTRPLYIPIFEFEKENNPCPNCVRNKHDHWDTIHYNCEENHTQTCPELKTYQEHRNALMSEIVEKQIKDIQTEHEKITDELYKKSNEIYRTQIKKKK